MPLPTPLESVQLGEFSLSTSLPSAQDDMNGHTYEQIPPFSLHTQSDLNDLVPNLGLSRKPAEVFSSKLKG